MCRQRRDTSARIRIPDLNGAVPGAGEKGFFGDEIPVYSKDFAGMLLP